MVIEGVPDPLQQRASGDGGFRPAAEHPLPGKAHRRIGEAGHRLVDAAVANGLNCPGPCAEQQQRTEGALEDLGALAVTRDADVDTPDERAIFEPAWARHRCGPIPAVAGLFDADADRAGLVAAARARAGAGA